MGYVGWRIKIDNTTIPFGAIVRGSYSVSRQDRVLDSYTDNDGIVHEAVARKKKTIISFALREHESKEHSTFARYVAKRRNIPVEYYDADSDEYLEGNFKIANVQWSHRNANASKVTFDATQIQLEEY